MCLLTDPDNANHGIEHVVHYHAPPGDVAERGIDLLAYVGERGTGARIGARHPAIADGGKEHGHHGNQYRGDHVTSPAGAQHAKCGHRCDRLNDDYAVEDQVPKSERSA